MDRIWHVVLLSLLPGAGNFAGAMAAEFLTTTPHLLNLALHAAAGIVIAIVSVELIPEALSVLPAWSLAAAFAAGGGAYLLTEVLIERLQGGGEGGRTLTARRAVSKSCELSTATFASSPRLL